MTAAVRRVLAEAPDRFDPRVYLGAGRSGIREMARQRLRLLGSAGQADAVLARWRELGCPAPPVAPGSS